MHGGSNMMGNHSSGAGMHQQQQIRGYSPSKPKWKQSGGTTASAGAQSSMQYPPFNQQRKVTKNF